VKILRVRLDNRRHAFDVVTRRATYEFPYALTKPSPSPGNPVREVHVDPELGNEGFTYVLASGDEGTVHVDHVLAHHEDPAYVREQLLYRLTLDAERAMAESGLSKRAVARSLRTSLSQLARLLDATNQAKSVDRMLALLGVLGRDVRVDVTRRKRAGAA